MKINSIDLLMDKTIERILVSEKELVFYYDNKKYVFHHNQYCCESVYIEDICGDLQDLIGSPILKAEEIINDENVIPDELKDIDPSYGYDDSYTWTFYKFDTKKGGVTIRWLGTSNGYYSESVDHCEINNQEITIQ